MTGSAARGASLAGLARRQDPDRYLCALFAPAARREALFVLIAFNNELARACEVTREPGLAYIRLQWWREVVEGSARAHEVATPLHIALSAGTLPRDTLLAMVEAREREAEGGFATLDAWWDWLSCGAGSMAVAAGQVLGAPTAALERLRVLGAGYGAAGQLRNVAAWAARGRCLLPADLLAAHGLSPDSVVAGVPPEMLRSALASLAESGLARLGPPQPCGRDWVAAGLPAILARRDLRRGGTVPRQRGLPDRAAVAASALRARC